MRAATFVSENQLWWTLALAPVLLLPGYFPHALVLAAVGLMALPWACRMVRTGADGARPGAAALAGFELLALIFLLWHLPGFYATVDSKISLEKYAQQLAGVGLACGLLSKTRTLAQLKRLTLLAVLGTAAVATVAPLVTQWQWPSKLLPALPAFLTSPAAWKFGEDLNANVLGGLMVLMLPAALGLLAAGYADFTDRPRLARAVTLAAALGIGGMLLVSQARGGYIGAALGLLLMAGLAGGRWRWACAASLWGGFAGLLWVGPGNLGTLLGGAGLVNTWDVRFELWSRASYMIQDFSFTGVGPGMYGKVANVLYPFFLISPDTEVGHAHNLMLQVGVDLGIPGLVIYCALLGYALRRGWPADGPERKLRIGLLCGLAGFLAHGLLDAVLWSNKLAAAPWFALGMLAALGGGRPSRLKRWEVAVWWLLVSLLAISFIGDHFGWGLALAIAGGALIGFLA